MDALTSMSTCAGYKGMLLAANALSKFVPQIFCAVGMIKPVNTLIIGAGVGGLQALATAKDWALWYMRRIFVPMPWSRQRAWALKSSRRECRQSWL